MSLRDKFEQELVPVLSLSRYDVAWATVLAESIFFRIWLHIKTGVQNALSKVSLADTLAKACELISFAMVLVLFLIIPAPMFADDKEKLALIVLAASAIRVFGILISNKLSYKPCATDFLVLAFAGMNVIATASSYYPVQSLKGLSKMIVYFCSYFLFTSTLQQSTNKRALMVIGAMLASATLVSLYGCYQYKIHVAPLATWEDPSSDDKTTRVYSTLKNPNLLAGYLVSMIPLSLGASVMAFCQKGWKRWTGIPLLGVAAVITACTWFTGSRGGYMGIGVGLAALAFVTMLIVWGKKPNLRLPIIGLFLVAPVALWAVLHFAAPSYEHRIASIFSGFGHSSNAYRINVYGSSIKMFLDNWWLGVGPGNSTFKLVYGLYMRSGFDALGTYCVPLEVAVETGIIGLAVFLAMVVSVLSRAHETFWKNPENSGRWLAAGAAAGLTAMMIHGLVDTVYYRPQVQFIFWMLLAICITAGRKITNSAAKEE